MKKHKIALAPIFAAILLAFGLVVGLAPDLRADSVTTDFGDAPDAVITGNETLANTFPSRLASGGPYHVDVNKEWIGTALASTTTPEADSLQPDGDSDDGFGWFTRTADATGRTKTWFVTNITRATTRPNADNTYLNVLVDLDNSKTWNGPGAPNEWAVRNVRVPFEGLPSTPPNVVQTITMVVRVPDAIIPGNQGNLNAIWIRETIGEKQVNDGTGAWGAFDRGETEDWITNASGNPPSTGENPCFWPKVQGIIAANRLKAIPKTPFALCPKGDCIGPVAPVLGPLKNVYDWQMYVPATTLFLAISQELGFGCTESPVGWSRIDCPAGAPPAVVGGLGAPLFGAPVIAGGVPVGGSGIILGQNNTFHGMYALTGPTGHAVCAADYMMIFDDPGGPYIGVYDNLTFNTGSDPLFDPVTGDPYTDPETGYPYPDVPYDPKHPGYVPLVPIPEPAALGLLVLTALLGLNARKRR